MADHPNPHEAWPPGLGHPFFYKSAGCRPSPFPERTPIGNQQSVQEDLEEEQQGKNTTPPDPLSLLLDSNH